MSNNLRTISMSIFFIILMQIFALANINIGTIDTSSWTIKTPYYYAPFGPSAINMPIIEQSFRFEELDKMSIDEAES